MAQKTEKEIRKEFLDHLHFLVDYWQDEKVAPTMKDKLNGLVFSILSTIDGCDEKLPGYILAPNVKDLDEYPDNSCYTVLCDISGILHEEFKF